MRIQQIKAVCAKTESVLLCDVPDGKGVVTQWLGSPCALYPLHNLPYMEMQNIANIFDLSSKQLKKWNFTHKRPEETERLGISFQDYTRTDTSAAEFHISVSGGGRTYVPYRGSGGRTYVPYRGSGGRLIMIDGDYLKPILADMDDTVFIEREYSDGRPYLVACNGLLISAVIMPAAPYTDPKFVEQLEELTSLCRKARETGGRD